MRLADGVQSATASGPNVLRAIALLTAALVAVACEQSQGPDQGTAATTLDGDFYLGDHLDLVNLDALAGGRLFTITGNLTIAKSLEISILDNLTAVGTLTLTGDFDFAGLGGLSRLNSIGELRIEACNSLINLLNLNDLRALRTIETVSIASNPVLESVDIADVSSAIGVLEVAENPRLMSLNLSTFTSNDIDLTVRSNGLLKALTGPDNLTVLGDVHIRFNNALLNLSALDHQRQRLSRECQ